ncbi:hypothetical protein M441DRAFT_447932 [Trichoderma asperellum CBS 433.97]|uniref:Uncharacterized protein n=1 Tax=Trichoderma asperellum (strain ATCC 204424 / CBS 433.97 / NBRC 101777) TaxID=1042311 RepID=A0A2T3YZ58_TRIA4|nr:hypothetical protein M441DRAFT_447932 [Trichoderma asperellum CBS 433.97]PTB37837.1 hypothetical protein M441DRAFT_447932 [Trichoderma asperellum CBS 433.97]
MRRIRWFASTPQGVGYFCFSLDYPFSPVQLSPLESERDFYFVCFFIYLYTGKLKQICDMTGEGGSLFLAHTCFYTCINAFYTK